MGTIQIDLPDELYQSLSSFGLSKEKMANESRKLVALKYFQDKILSLGKAAELSGISKWDFIEYLSENGVPVIDHGQLEIEKEFNTVDKFVHKMKVK